MKAIVYHNEEDAVAAIAQCSQIVQDGSVRQEGAGPFLNPNRSTPYTSIVKHPSEEKWAVIADEHVEQVLETAAIELDATWFPQTPFIGTSPADT